MATTEQDLLYSLSHGNEALSGTAVTAKIELPKATGANSVPKNIKILGFALVATAASILVAQAGPTTSESTPNQGSDDLLGKAMTYLSINDSGSQNVVLAPASVDGLLHMLGAGAANETKDAYHDALGDRQPSPDSRSYLPATSAWISNAFGFSDAYGKTLADKFAAELLSFDPTTPEATTEAVNAWVSEATEGQVQELLTEVPANTEMLLVSGAFFKGSWLESFDPEATKPESFSNWAGDEFEVDNLRGTKAGGYARLNGAQAFTLPFANDAIFAEIILPEDAAATERCLQITDPCQWLEAEKDIDASVLDIHLPKFSVSFQASLIPLLEPIGLGLFADGSRSDFGAMTSTEGDRGPQLSEIITSARITVDESGALAASATAGVMTTRMAGDKLSTPIEMRIDRPFLFIIRHPEIEAPLFVSYIVDPR